jgi:formate hydrogenlyase subunit 4
VTLSALAGLFAVLVFAPAMPGIANRTKSALTGRRGAPTFQLYADLGKLWQKGVVYSRATTVLFRLGPVIVLTATLVAAGFLPLNGRDAPMHFAGDLIAFAGLLALGRFMLVLAALDTGSSFEGMGASREVTIAAFAEPALILCFTVLVLATGDMRLEQMLGPALAVTWPVVAPSVLLAAAGLFILSLAETCRVPVDDPLTHLELTMIHEVMVLDHSGADLALILYSSALKMALFGTLIIRILIGGAVVPAPMALAFLLSGLAGYAIAVGVVESAMARLRMDRVPQLLVAASVVSGFGLILLLR